LQTLDEDGLRKQLLRAPELALDEVPGSTEGLIKVAERMQGLGLHFPGPALITRARRDLAGLQLRMGMECTLSKENAERLQVLSRKLRTHLEASIPRGRTDPRPDPDRLRDRLLGSSKEWQTPDAIPALLQLLQAENKPIRLVLVELLNSIKHPRSSQALAMRAMVDLSPEVREAALLAMKDRPPEDSRDLLLAGLSYPWYPVQQHAAEALVALKDQGAIPELARTLNLPPSTVPFEVPQGKKRVLVTRELVRVNHLTNCALCHPPSFARADLVRGAVPRRDRPLPPPNSTPYYEGPGRMVRADTTYLRQDFSVIQPVMSTTPGWPTQQRMDYMTRTRPLTPKEQKYFEKVKGDLPLDKLREPVLHALRGLTKKDLGDNPVNWRGLSTEPAKPRENPSRAGDWGQFLFHRDIVVAAIPEDPAKLVKALLKAAPSKVDGLLGQLRDGRGVEFTDALANAIPGLKDEVYKRARTALAERLSRMTANTLREKLAEPDPEVRRAAVIACASRGFVELAPEIISLLEGKNPDVASAAWVALKELSGKDFGPVSTSRQQAEAARRYREWWNKREAAGR
jgi:HEAT repeat protein